MLAALMWIDSPAFIGPFSNRTQGSDFSVFMGIVVGGLVYWLLARRTVPAEAVQDIPTSGAPALDATG